MANENNLTFKVIDSGAYGSISSKSQKIVADKGEYERLFSELNNNIFPAPSFPPYSNKSSYIFLTFGEKPSGGLDFNVEKIEIKDNQIVVKLKSLTKDNELSIGTMAIANPYMVIEIPRTNIKSISVIY